MESQMGCIFTIVAATLKIHSVVDITDESDIHVVSEEHATAWEELYVPSIHSREDPNPPTELAPSTPVPKKGRHPQYLTHRILTQIKETHLRKNQPLELLLELKQRSA